MRNKEKDARDMAEKNAAFLKASYELFTEKSIESVSMEEIALRSGYGVATLYRYYTNKTRLVIAVATETWKKFSEKYKGSKKKSFDEMSAVQIFDFFLESFIILYTDHKDMLKFNQMFNIFIQSSKVGLEDLEPYEEMIGSLAKQFHIMYEKAKTDKTLKTDAPEEEVFSTTLHIMLAAITRYAVGLVYKPSANFDEVKELRHLKGLLLKEYSL